jgi:hypothetical protein
MPVFDFNEPARKGRDMPNRRNMPYDPRAKNESQKFGDWFRAGNRPGVDGQSDVPKDGPPFPNPTVEEVLAMADGEEKIAAAGLWLQQFCDRARHVLGENDLRQAAKTKDKCRVEIDKVRRLLSAEEIDRILSGA